MSVAPVCPGITTTLAAFLVGLSWLQPFNHLISSPSRVPLTCAAPAPRPGSEPLFMPSVLPSAGRHAQGH